MQLFIKNARVIDPRSRLDEELDILAEDGLIAVMGKGIEESERYRKYPRHLRETMDASGLIAAPGLVDIHVHFRDPGFTHKEDILSGAKAAVKGGYTGLVLMANTKPVVDNTETLQYVIEKGKETGIHIYTCATITKGMMSQEVVDMEALKKAGAVGFTDDGRPLMDEGVVREAMSLAKKTDTPLSFHEEDPAFISESGINAGEIAGKLGYKGADRKSEYRMVERDIRLAKETGARINIQHISTKEAVEAVRKAKEEGIAVYAEAAPHHFSLTEEAVLKYGTRAKMNPPLRTEEDRQAIIQGLQDGTIDFIASDHAPHTSQEKEEEFTKAPSGIIGLETELALGITYLVKTGKLSLMELLKKMTWNPADFYRLNAGYLKEGGPADLVIFDPDMLHTYYRFASRSENSPFKNQTLKSEVLYTVCNGKIIYIKSMEE